MVGGAPPRLQSSVPSAESDKPSEGRNRQVSMPPGHRPPRGRKESSAALPAGWATHTDDEGNAFYYHAASGQSTYEHPSAPTVPPSPAAGAAQLLAGWAAYTDDDGNTYYHNAASGESTYTMPAGATPQAQKRARVLFPYAAASEAELSLNEGDLVTIMNTGDDGWWTGELGGKTGLFPATYVKEL